MENDANNIHKKPNWMILKEAAERLYMEGRTSFTRKELTSYAKKIDPSRPETSLDFEIDLVTVNSNSKDRYRDPEKLFLFRISRGRYTLYDPEVHGPLEKYLEPHRYFPTRKRVLRQIMEELKMKGYDVWENKQQRKPLAPDLIAEIDGKRIGIWVIDPGVDKSTQLKTLAYAIGSSLLDTSFNQHIIALPQHLINKIPKPLKEFLNSHNVKLAYLREEKRYTIVF